MGFVWSEVDLFMTGNNCQCCHFLAGFSRGARLTTGCVCPTNFRVRERRGVFLSFSQENSRIGFLLHRVDLVKFNKEILSMMKRERELR